MCACAGTHIWWEWGEGFNRKNLSVWRMATLQILGILKILWLLLHHRQIFLMARIAMGKALCKHRTKMWFLCKKAYIYRTTGDSRWLQRGVQTIRNWYQATRQQNTKAASIHTTFFLSLIFWHRKWCDRLSLINPLKAAALSPFHCLEEQKRLTGRV